MEYCCESIKNFVEGEGCIYIEDRKWTIDWDEWDCGDSWREEREIYYCPFCGEKLGGKNVRRI